jgi:hypothetical protein
MKNTILFLLFILAIGCKKETSISPAKPSASKVATTFTEGTHGILIINSFSAAGSQKENEFGNAEDWIELFNTTGNTLTLESGKWFLTDDVESKPAKFELPELTIEPYGSLIIWCDKMNTVEDDIHTNFKLSSSGEKIGLFYFTGSDYAAIDICSYCSVKK